MNTERLGPANSNDPQALLERAFIAQYLRGRVDDMEHFHDLPEELVRQLMTEACTYASARLTEMEARARFISEVHGVAPPM